jgi:hypothetical protein
VDIRKLTAGEAPVRPNTATRITADILIMLLDETAEGADSMWSLKSSPSVFISGSCYPSIKGNNKFVVTGSRIAHPGITRHQCRSLYKKGLSDILSVVSFIITRITLREQ